MRDARLADGMSAAFATLQRFVREASGLALDDDKHYLVEDRLAPVLRAAKLGSLDDLAKIVAREPYGDLARAVAETLTINETSFFRDRGLFAAFADHALPSVMQARADERRLRIWCAGCSSGQEPYSLAMVLDEHARKLSGWRVDIVATDISQAMIDTAQRGLYSQFEVQRGVPVALLLRYFRRDGERWQISDHLRAKINFRVQNLLKRQRDVEPFDIVFCRNVLFYFDAEMKRRVLSGLDEVLAPGGWLALGATESVGGLCAGIEAQAAQRFLFRKAARTPSLRLVPAVNADVQAASRS